MCGLYGFKTKKELNKLLTKKQQKDKQLIIKGLGIVMQERGTDSTGIAMVTDKSIKIMKQAIDGYSFFTSDKVMKHLDCDAETIIGHTRFATTGAVTKKNSHPFKKGSIIGAHNGMISNYLEIDKTLQVDSEAIFVLLNQYKTKPLKALKRLSGSFAVTWIDSDNTDNLYMCRYNNPLYTAYVDELGTMFWASTILALELVLSLVGYKAYIVELQENYIYTYNEGLTKTSKVKFKTKKDKYISYPTWLNNEGVDDESITYGDFCEYCYKEISHHEGGYIHNDSSIVLCSSCFKEIGNSQDYEYFCNN